MRSDDPDPMNLKAGVLIMSDASVQQLEAATLRARVAELEEALRWFVDEYERVQAMRQAYVHAPDCRCVLCAYDNARAALKET